MGKTLDLNFRGYTFSLSPMKVERRKLYGYTEVRGIDLSTGKTLVQAGLNGNGVTIVPKGGTKIGLLCDGNWMEREELKAIGPDGTAVEKYPSTFDTPVDVAKLATSEELLDNVVCSVYQLTGDDSVALAHVIGDRIYSFPFCYTATYNRMKAFLLSKGDECYIVIGEPADFEMIGLQEQATLDNEDTDGDVDVDDFDFGNMF